MPMATVMTTMLARTKQQQQQQQSGDERLATQARTRRKRMLEAAEAARGDSLGTKALEIVESLALQTLLYFLFVIIFQSLATTLRDTREYYMDYRVMADIVQEDFDASHNSFESIRRIADVYEWGNNVLWSSLFAAVPVCNPGTVGSRAANHPTQRCNGHVWADGEGPHTGFNATAFTVDEAVRLMDNLDWTEGILIKQLRAEPQPCPGGERLGVETPAALLAAGYDGPGDEPICWPELGEGQGSAQSFGYNHTHPSQPMAEPWVHFTAAELGGNPAPGGVRSAAIPSMQGYEASGFVALVIPFFSESWLDEEHGLAADVTDYRLTYVNATNARTPRFFCIRTSHNGRHVRQLCDPTDDPVNKNGRLTGAVREAAEQMWNDLKRGHFLDTYSRTLTFTLQLRSNHLGIRYRLSLMLELTSLGATLPSYDVETRVLSEQAASDMWTFANLSLVLVLFFAVVEILEIFKHGYEGCVEYMSDAWNWMDWINYSSAQHAQRMRSACAAHAQRKRSKLCHLPASKRSKLCHLPACTRKPCRPRVHACFSPHPHLSTHRLSTAFQPTRLAPLHNPLTPRRRRLRPLHIPQSSSSSMAR